MYNILICDDQPDIVNALKIYLASEEYRLFEAYTGQQALDMVRKGDFHLILLDIMMPHMDGITATAKIREFSNVPIILLSQLSRGPEARTSNGHRPIMADLRESGAIEQDADEVLFLYREDYYNKETEKQNVAECIVAKNRHGETGKVELRWMPEYTQFSTLDNRYDDDE